MSEGPKRRLNANDNAFEGREMLGMNDICSSCNKFKILNSIIQTNEARKEGENPKIKNIPQSNILREDRLQSQKFLNYHSQTIHNLDLENNNLIVRQTKKKMGDQDKRSLKK